MQEGSGTAGGVLKMPCGSKAEPEQAEGEGDRDGTFLLGMGGGNCPRYLGRMPRGEVQASSTLQWRGPVDAIPSDPATHLFFKFLQSGTSIRGAVCVWVLG